MDSKPAIAIVQARMSSSRLPGKVLLPLANKPIIAHIVERVRLCKYVDRVIVATSKEKSDNVLSDYCLENNIDCYRGSLNNVLSRYADILQSVNYDYCVRITGDCPLIHPPFIDAQIEALKKFNGDLLWASRQSSVLEGQGVISSRAIFTVNMKSNDPDDLEHVGSKFFISHPDEFKFVELTLPEKYYTYNYRLTIDEIEDYDFLKNIYNQFWSKNPINLDDVLSMLENVQETVIINRNVQHSNINKELKSRRMEFIPELVGSFHWSSA